MIYFIKNIKYQIFPPCPPCPPSNHNTACSVQFDNPYSSIQANTTSERLAVLLFSNSKYHIFKFDAPSLSMYSNPNYEHPFIPAPPIMNPKASLFVGSFS